MFDQPTPDPHEPDQATAHDPHRHGAEDATIHACIDRVLPTDFGVRAMAEQAAVDENMRNYVPEAQRAAFVTRGAIEHGKRWQPGRTLRVRFLDDDPRVHEKVAAVWAEWSEYANIKFERSADLDAEIRISFQQPGSWSYIGTDALLVPVNKPTMNYGWLRITTPDEEYRRVVLHEFGHALGMIHEHQNPSVAIPWDREVVYTYYSGPPNRWTREQVDRNLFQTYDRELTNFTDFDRDSIMLYPVPQELTIGDYAVGWNRALSETDKTFVRSQYPFDEAADNELTIDGAPIDAAINQQEKLDIFTFVVAEPDRYRVETSGDSDVVMSLFGPNDATSLLAEDDDSGTRLNARIDAHLQPGRYTVQVRHFSPNRTGEYNIAVRRAP